ncbi:MAG TPA: hypothetical protein VLD13_06785 [Gaiellaceae bacterium]|nr:hypothetical protein [Gaiellaceae bacterium]
MFKLAAIVGGVLLLAGVALAGTVTSLDSTNSPTLGKLPLAAATTAGQDDLSRGREARGRAQEPGEDLRGPCDEAEHASDPRCAAAGRTTTVRHDDRGSNRGHDAGDDHAGQSGRGGGGEPGHGGHGRDD